MARFVIAQKRLSRPETAEIPKDWSWTEVIKVLGPSVKPLHEMVTPEGENARIVLLEGNAEEVEQRAGALPSWVWLEPEIRHWPNARSRTPKCPQHSWYMRSPAMSH